jgi:hypothetical protein
LYSRVDSEQKKSCAAVRLPHLNAGILVAGVEIFDYAFLFVSRHSSGWREESRTVAAPLNQLGHWIFLFSFSLSFYFGPLEHTTEKTTCKEALAGEALIKSKAAALGFVFLSLAFEPIQTGRIPPGEIIRRS